jgi:F0F1-type ATP synthase beta subunit
MDGTEGLIRGAEVVNTGSPISIPVGEETLGRIMNVIGEPIDERGPINAKKFLPIHNKAPEFSEQSTEQEILVTGIKVWLPPYGRG